MSSSGGSMSASARAGCGRFARRSSRCFHRSERMRAVAIAMLAGMILCAQGATAVDDVTRAALANRVEGGHTVGVEVGLATTEGRAFAVHGLIAKGGTAPTKDTVFEIGSITKV